jgi:flagellar FliL protein
MAKDQRERANTGGGDAALALASAKKKKLLLLAGVMAALLLVGVAATLFARGVFDGKGSADSSEVEPATAAASVPSAARYLALEPPFLTNYSVEGRQRYLQLSLTLMAREQSVLEAANQHMPLIRNRIVLLLSGENFHQLQSDLGRRQLQEKILVAVQEILQAETGIPGIEQVYFTGLVMQ